MAPAINRIIRMPLIPFPLKAAEKQISGFQLTGFIVLSPETPPLSIHAV